jgi:Fe(3+) dicitrate transport protein
MNNAKYFTVYLLLVLVSAAQAATIKGTVKDKSNGTPIFGALVYSGTHGAYTDQDGNFRIENVNAGSYWFQIRLMGYSADSVKAEVSRESELVLLGEIMLAEAIGGISDPVVISDYYTNRPSQRLTDIDGTVINSGKKNDVIMIDQTDANVVLSNPRQLFARVPGINVWENDGTGTGISIATRGLSPNRSWEFNLRQNGYDIASDPVGYPEAYFVPPMEGVESIEILRGASALQYGSQFGGMVNYRMKKAPDDKPVQAEVSLTGGSFGMMNSFVSLGGTKGKISYYGYYNYRRADGWRENTSYFNNNGFASFTYRPTEKMTIGLEYTGMYYILQQPGGLTDSMFKANARESVRERNWFSIRWNMPAFNFRYEFNNHWMTELKAVAILSERNSVGYTGTPNTADNMGQRTVDRDYYTNFGAEWRNIWKYNLFGEERSALSFGARFYQGHTDRKQGKGTDGTDAEFIFANPDNMVRDLDLNSQNIAFFAENLFRIGKNLKVSPGVRYEMIMTSAEGIPAVKKEERNYNFPLFGVAGEYKLPFGINIYGNWSQSYRPVTFSELWTTNAALVIDPNITASKGWSSDAGIRGSYRNALYYDISTFLMQIEGRIGDVTTTDDSGNSILMRTNAGNSKHSGVEAYVDVHPLQFFSCGNKFGDFGLFSSVSYTEAYYTEGANIGKRVEYAPRWTVRSGLSYQYRRLSTTFTWTYNDGVYSDAKNTASSTSGTSGWIPSYNVLDWSVTCKLPKNFAVKGSLNNITDNMYFTRRSGGYPGPGILPCDGRSFAVTLSAKF